MKTGTSTRKVRAAFYAILAFCQYSMSVQAADVDVVKVDFANSCSGEVQTEFSHAMTLLHSFEYPETGRIFGEIIDQDPSCAIARWGAAMSIWHPLWAPPSKEGLDEGARILAETENLSATEREAAYIDAAKAFFSSNDMNTHRDRARMFETRMSALYASHLDDPEADSAADHSYPCSSLHCPMSKDDASDRSTRP